MIQILKFYKPRPLKRVIRKRCLKFLIRSLQGWHYALLEASRFRKGTMGGFLAAYSRLFQMEGIS